MSSSVEDAMCRQRIREARELTDRSNELFDGGFDVTIEVEKHYNHYGDRGVADLFVRELNSDGFEDDFIYEFKSDAAIEEATGANEIVRQFNRMCTYFYKDERIDLPRATAWSNASSTFELCFNATPKAYEHVLENYEIYQSIADPEVPTGLRDSGSWVTFRFPHRSGPVIATFGGDECDRLTKEEFIEMYECAESERVAEGGVLNE